MDVSMIGRICELHHVSPCTSSLVHVSEMLKKKKKKKESFGDDLDFAHVAVFNRYNASGHVVG